VRRFVFGYQENDFIYEGKELPVVILIFTIDNERMFGLCDCPTGGRYWVSGMRVNCVVLKYVYRYTIRKEGISG
jgi:hypothetical protein